MTHFLSENGVSWTGRSAVCGTDDTKWLCSTATYCSRVTVLRVAKQKVLWRFIFIRNKITIIIITAIVHFKCQMRKWIVENPLQINTYSGDDVHILVLLTTISKNVMTVVIFFYLGSFNFQSIHPRWADETRRHFINSM